MTKQRYRVIADRDKGDDPRYIDIHPGDRVTYGDGPWVEPVIRRIERPVPTLNQPVQYDGSNGLAVFADAARRLSEGRPGPSPHPPTREQIAEAFDAMREDSSIPRQRDGSVLAVDAFEAGFRSALALIQNGADR